MKLGPITKVALAGGLLLGQTQPTDKFYEDDEDFNLTSAVLSQGWNWSINQAQAADECTNNESTSAEQCIEHIEVEGEYDPSGDLSLYDHIESGQYDNIETQTSSGGVGGYEPQEYVEVTDCESQAQQDYQECISDARDIARMSEYWCYKGEGADSTDYQNCLLRVDQILNIDSQQCEDIKQDDLQKCP